jgi:hypothetical protein
VKRAALVLCATTAHADDDRVVPCRPTVTCTAELAPPGELELELGYQLRRASDHFEHAAPLLIKLPIASWVEAQLGTDYAITPTAHYIDTIVVGGKLHLVDQRGPWPSLALTLAAGAPTWSQQGYTRAYDLFATAHASKDWGKLHVDWNAGLYAWQVEGPVHYQPFTALAASYALTSRLSVALEPHYFGYAEPLAPRDAGAIAAVGYALRPWLVLDAAVDVVFADQGSVAGIAGVSVAPARLW